MLRSLFGSRWKQFPAHLLFLSKFSIPRPPDYCVDSDEWQSVLQESPQRVIRRFIKDHMLESATLADLMAHKYKVSDLKQMLRDRQLRVSGRKAQLIERLLAADRQGMEVAVQGLQLLQLTEEGEATTQRFLAKKEEERAAAEEETLKALQEHSFATASQVVARYEAKQVFPRGIGIDWAHYDPKRDVAILTTISDETPKILQTLTEEQIEQLRIPAAMMHLWGKGRPGDWLPDGFALDSRMDSASAIRMMVFYAYHRWDLLEYREAGFETVRILAAADACDACKALAASTHSLSEVPELPHYRCTSDLGCRCTLVVALDDVSPA